jgi:hypothetical protein
METDRLDALRPAGVLRPQVLVEIQQRPPLEDPAPAGCNTRIADPPIVRAAVSRRPYRSWPAVSGRVARTCRPDARSRRRCPSPRRCTASRCGLPSRTPPATPHRTGSASRPGAPGQPGRSGRAAAARYGIGHRPTIRHPAGSSRHLAPGRRKGPRRKSAGRRPCSACPYQPIIVPLDRCDRGGAAGWRTTGGGEPPPWWPSPGETPVCMGMSAMRTRGSPRGSTSGDYTPPFINQASGSTCRADLPPIERGAQYGRHAP